MVVRIWVRPSSSITTRGCSPPASSSVAAVCRLSCSRTCRTPALFSRSRQACLLVDRPTVGLREHEVLVVPLVGGEHPLAGLTTLVLDQLRDQPRRQGEGPDAALGLGRLEDEALALDAVDRAPHRERATEQIDILPLQGERFGLPQAAGEGDGPAGGVALTTSGCQHGRGFLDGERGGDVARLLRGRVDEAGDVAVHATARCIATFRAREITRWTRSTVAGDRPWSSRRA